ncbi:MAG: prepilin-type N-terminal cleavage/methylation domain-containing protein [Xanthobacteraceae bacterium]|jgi:general secretion pathway protein I
MTSERRRSAAGFTMIEVLAALALVAVSVSAIGSLMFGSSKGVRAIEDHLALVETARLLSTSLPGREDLVPGRLSGELLGQRWRLDITPFSGGGPGFIPDSVWIPETLVIQVQSPSGTTVSLETVRLQHRRPS